MSARYSPPGRRKASPRIVARIVTAPVTQQNTVIVTPKRVGPEHAEQRLVRARAGPDPRRDGRAATSARSADARAASPGGVPGPGGPSTITARTPEGQDGGGEDGGEVAHWIDPAPPASLDRALQGRARSVSTTSAYMPITVLRPDAHVERDERERHEHGQLTRRHVGEALPVLVDLGRVAEEDLLEGDQVVARGDHDAEQRDRGRTAGSPGSRWRTRRRRS